MKIQKFFSGVLLAFVPFLIFSCLGKGVTKSAFKAPDANMVICLPSFAGSESISLTPIFKISNPNDFLVEVMMDYKLEAGNQFVGKSMVSTVFIPPNKTIEIKDTIVISFKASFVSEVFGGKSKKEAVMVVAPLWKSLGGKRPATLPEALWNKIPEKKPAMRARGSIFVAAEAGQEIFHFTTEWQDSK